MKAVILAGGLGTRLKPLTYSRPKPLLPLLNRPVIEHILDYLHRHGVSDVAVTTNYLRNQIIEYFGTVYRSMKLTYPIEDEPLGTAGSVKNIEDFFDDTFIVMQGDVITDMDLTALVRQHEYYSGLCTIGAVKVRDPWNYGVMSVADDGRVRQFYEKPVMGECFTDLVNTGVYVMEPQALGMIPPSTFYDFSKDLFPMLLERQSLFSQVTDSFWIDMGRPEGYDTAKKWMFDKLVNNIPGCTVLDGSVEGVVSLGEHVSVGAHSSVVGPVVMGDEVTIGKDCRVGPYTVLGSQVKVRDHTVLDGAVLFDQNEVGTGNNISNCFIADSCRIGSGDKIQSDVIIGDMCHLRENVSVANGSRIWPQILIDGNCLVNGTLKRFIQVNEIRNDDPIWSLRTLTSEEAFYFNKTEGNHVSHTGLRARSLLEFNDLIRQVEMSSLNYHLRSDINDFQHWLDSVICDIKLAGEFRAIKRDYMNLGKKVIRHRMTEVTARRLNELLERVRPKGYV